MTVRDFQQRGIIEVLSDRVKRISIRLLDCELEAEVDVAKPGST